MHILLYPGMLKENLQVIEMTGYKSKREKFVQLALVHTLYSSG